MNLDLFAGKTIKNIEVIGDEFELETDDGCKISIGINYTDWESISLNIETYDSAPEEGSLHWETIKE